MKDLELRKLGKEHLNSLFKIFDEMAMEKKLNNPIPLDDVGEAVRSFRKEKNINQSDFADLCGVSKNVLASIEANKQSVKLGNFVRVTSFMGLKVSLHE